MKSIERLRNQFESVVAGLSELINELSIEYFESEGHGIVFVGPSYYWGDRTPAQKSRQLALKRKYETVFELISLSLSGAPIRTANELSQADKRFRTWLELTDNWSINPDRAQNATSLREDSTKIDDLLGILSAGNSAGTIIVADTNSLLAKPDPTEYRHVAKAPAFEFLLLPTVLAELDRLKIEHKNPDVREKATSVIRRIKGWRLQGGLLEGVITNKNITVRAVHSEPDMQNTLSWLVPDNADDRIIASVLSIQAAAPNSNVILVTGDINLQNKADAALVEVVDLDS